MKPFLQQFIIRPPLQHPALGGPLSFTALMAYQASAYSLIYVTYLSPVVQPYSIQAADPFEGYEIGRSGPRFGMGSA